VAHLSKTLARPSKPKAIRHPTSHGSATGSLAFPLANPGSFAMSQDQQKQKPADRVYLAKDDYPESFGFGTFGAAYRRTYYDVVRGSAIPSSTVESGIGIGAAGTIPCYTALSACGRGEQMGKADDYRGMAKQCLVLAQQVTGDETRSILLHMAGAWFRLADLDRSTVQEQQQQIQPKAEGL
jgi:hypothetical protein